MPVDPGPETTNRRALLRAGAAGAVTAAVAITAASPAAAAPTRVVRPVAQRPRPIRRALVRKQPSKAPVRPTPSPTPTPTPVPSVVALTSPLAPDVTGCTTTPEWIMARRVALGSSYVVADQIKKVGMAAWLDAQFKPDTIAEPFIEATKSKYPGVWMTREELNAYLPQASGVPISYITEQLRRVHVLRSVYTQRHLQTAMADFWLDFFSFPYNENKVFGSARDLDKMARELAFKPFADVFERFIVSGAMWSYLDNSTSTKAHPNENLAREMMELYSVGIGNHTEADIKAAAKLLSGISPGLQADGTVQYWINEYNHYFGPVTIRGVTYPNKSWQVNREVAADIKRFVRGLATDPITARNICARLAQRFVSDAPPAALVTAMTSAWTASGGNIEKVLRAMFAHPTWLTTAGHKMRRPAELWASMAATAQMQWTHAPAKGDYFTPPISNAFAQILAAGQPVRDWPSPKGMPDSNTHWSGSASLLGGFNFADAIMHGTEPHLTRTGEWAQRLGVTTDLSFEDAAVRIIERTTGFVAPAAHPITIAVIKRLNEGTTPHTAKAKLPTLNGVERAVQTAFNSPLMFLR